MKLKDCMTYSLQCIDASAPIVEAAKKMKAAGVGMLPVLRNGELVGIVTDRDLVVRCLAEGRMDCKVADMMTTETVCVDKEAEIADAIDTMLDQRIGRLIVTDKGKSVVGVLSAGDIAVICNGDEKVGRLAERLGTAHRRHAMAA